MQGESQVQRGPYSKKFKNFFLSQSKMYDGTKVTWKIYFILRAHAVADMCASISYHVHTQ